MEKTFEGSALQQKLENVMKSIGSMQVEKGSTITFQSGIASVPYASTIA